jgi:hypothetical protein
MNTTTAEKYDGTPEAFMQIPESEKFPIDAINCAQSRIYTVLTMLIVALNSKGAEDIHPHTIAESLWAIQGNLDQIKIMVEHSYKMSGA